MRKLIRLWPLLLLSACGWFREAAPPPADPDVPLPISALPAARVLTDGSLPLWLQVDAGTDGALQLKESDESSGQIELRMVRRDEQMTMLAIRSRAAQRIKLVLYLSPDGEQYVYTSSCPIAPGIVSYESWPHSVAWIAVASAAADSDGACR